MTSLMTTADSDSDSNFIIQVETKQSNHFKSMISVIKSQIPEINLLISEDSIEILSNSHDTFFIHVELFASQFDKYICNKPMAIGLNVSNLDKILKGVMPKDILTIFVEDPSRTLSVNESNSTYPFGFIIEKPDASQFAQIFIDPIDVDISNKELDNLSMQSYEITLPSTDLCDIVSQLKSMAGEVVNIRYTKDQLIFFTKGECGRLTIVRDRNVGGASATIGKPSKSSEIISVNIKIQKLIEYSKCSQMSSNVKLYLNHEKLCVLEYDIGNLGKIKLGASVCDTPQDWPKQY